MELNDIQKEAVAEWVAEGMNLSDIQKRINAEFDISMTYMDVRFMVIDIGAEVQDKPEPVSIKKIDDNPAVDDTEQHAFGLVVDIDAITQPGAVVSGTVIFTDGVKASWLLDQSGRLSLDAGDPGYKPSEDDLQAFQKELASALKKKGF